jgi:hypothetical protein
MFVLYVGSRRSVRWLDCFLAVEKNEIACFAGGFTFWRILNVLRLARLAIQAPYVFRKYVYVNGARRFKNPKYSIIHVKTDI